MERNSDLHMIAAQVRHGLTVLSKFRCNRASAGVFLERLGALAWCFGAADEGLLALSMNVQLPKDLVSVWVNVLILCVSVSVI